MSEPATLDSSTTSQPHATGDRAVRLRRADRVSTRDLALRWRDCGDAWARDALVDRFGPLTRQLARRYVTSNEPLEDLMQVASIGLLAAINRFDPDRGVPFPAFAIPTILGELKRHFRNVGWAVHVPRGPQEMALRVDNAVHELATRNGRAPSVSELAQYLEVDTEQVLAGLEAGTAHYAMSLDAPANTTDDEERESLHESFGNVDDGYALVEITASLPAAMTRLPHLERQAFTLRFREDLKQSEIAERLDCSQMQVSRLARRARTRLRALTDPDPTEWAPAVPVAVR